MYCEQVKKLSAVTMPGFLLHILKINLTSKGTDFYHHKMSLCAKTQGLFYYSIKERSLKMFSIVAEAPSKGKL